MVKQVRKSSREIKTVYFLVLFIFIHLLYAIFWGGLKQDAYIDEYWSYGLANNMGSIVVRPENGIVYQGPELFHDFFAVQNGENFNYSNVWAQQALDVHPPFYYVILHTVCSLFPGTFNFWLGLLPNFIFLVIIDILLYLIAQSLLKSQNLALITVIANGTGVMMMNMIVFIRMYAMLTVFILALIHLSVSYRDKEKDIKFWPTLYLITVLGTMTQYYFLIFLFFWWLFQEALCVYRKRWKESLLFIVTMVAAALTCIWIFSPILEQILGSSGRGAEARRNFAALEGVRKAVKEYAEIILDQLFGGFYVGLILFLSLGVFLILRIKKTKTLIKEISTEEWMLLFVILSYLAVIIKISPYHVDRYIMSFGWCMVLLVIDLIYRMIRAMKPEWKEQIIYILICCICLGLNVLSMASHHWGLPYAYLERREELASYEAYREYPAVFIYRNEPEYRIIHYGRELPLYESYTFLNVENAPEMLADRNEENMVLYIMDDIDSEELLDKISGADDNRNTLSLIGSYYVTNVYYLEKNR